jgi:hypothetical protein
MMQGTGALGRAVERARRAAPHRREDPEEASVPAGGDGERLQLRSGFLAEAQGGVLPVRVPSRWITEATRAWWEREGKQFGAFREEVRCARPPATALVGENAEMISAPGGARGLGRFEMPFVHPLSAAGVSAPRFIWSVEGVLFSGEFLFPPRRGGGQGASR